MLGSDIVVKAIGKRVELVRRHLNYKQKDFARALEISSANLSEIEAGVAKPRFEILYGLSIIFKVNLLYLLQGDGEMFITDKKAEEKDEYEEVVQKLKKFPEFKDWFDKFICYFNDSPMVRYSMMSYFSTYRIENEELIKRDIQITKGENKSA
jgi:transcriptional regulator with XRE-family HTH domain